MNELSYQYLLLLLIIQNIVPDITVSKSEVKVTAELNCGVYKDKFYTFNFTIVKQNQVENYKILQLLSKNYYQLEDPWLPFRKCHKDINSISCRTDWVLEKSRYVQFTLQVVPIKKQTSPQNIINITSFKNDYIAETFDRLVIWSVIANSHSCYKNHGAEAYKVLPSYRNIALDWVVYTHDITTIRKIKITTISQDNYRETYNPDCIYRRSCKYNITSLEPCKVYTVCLNFTYQYLHPDSFCEEAKTFCITDPEEWHLPVMIAVSILLVSAITFLVARKLYRQHQTYIVQPRTESRTTPSEVGLLSSTEYIGLYDSISDVNSSRSPNHTEETEQNPVTVTNIIGSKYNQEKISTHLTQEDQIVSESCETSETDNYSVSEDNYESLENVILKCALYNENDENDEYEAMYENLR